MVAMQGCYAEFHTGFKAGVGDHDQMQMGSGSNCYSLVRQQVKNLVAGNLRFGKISPSSPYKTLLRESEKSIHH